jgi:hypothetical protein
VKASEYAVWGLGGWRETPVRLLDPAAILCLDANMQAVAAATKRLGGWRVILVLFFALLAASFLLLASRRPSRWQLSIDFSNWRIRGTQQIEFDEGGLQVLSRNTRYFGPIAISSVHFWTHEEAHPSIGSRMD